MPVLEPISPANAMLFKDVRLTALLDSPKAFGGTYATESQLSDADWVARAGKWSSGRSAGYLAIENGRACGIAAAFLDEHDPLKAHLISMWVAPTHRRLGLGRALIDAIYSWAAGRESHLLQCMVIDSNNGVIEFYKRNGFSMTGHTETYPNDPTLIEYEMSRPVLLTTA